MILKLIEQIKFKECFFICIFIIFIYHIYKKVNVYKNNIEKMTVVSNNQIANAVSKYYISDDFIKNMIDVSIKIQTEGLKLSGNLFVRGNIIASNEISNNNISLSGINNSINTFISKNQESQELLRKYQLEEAERRRQQELEAAEQRRRRELEIAEQRRQEDERKRQEEERKRQEAERKKQEEHRAFIARHRGTHCNKIYGQCGQKDRIKFNQWIANGGSCPSRERPAWRCQTGCEWDSSWSARWRGKCSR